jgi:serine phosphatase RsbU (regulator of sigma subunit)
MMKDLNQLQSELRSAKSELDEFKLAYSNLLHDVLSFNEIISKKDNTLEILTLVLRLARTIIDFSSGIIFNFQANEFQGVHSINLDGHKQGIIDMSLRSREYYQIVEDEKIQTQKLTENETRILVPIITKQQPLGLLDIYINQPQDTIKQQDLDLLWILASIAAIEYESVEMSNRSELLALMLSSLEKINSEDKLDNLLYLILNNLKQIVPASSYLLILRDKLLEVSDNVHYCLPEIHSLDEICQLVDEAIKTKSTRFINKLSECKNCKNCTESYMHAEADGSLMLVPLYKGELGYGVISIYEKDDTKNVFSPYNRHIIEIFAKQATIAINNAILIDQQKKTNQKLAGANDELSQKNNELDIKQNELIKNQKELQKAHDELSQKNKILSKEIESAGVVQTAILSNIDRVEDLDIAIDYKPHHSIGGDYYGIVKIDATRTLIYIGDVSGKGVPAAITNGYLKNEFNFVINKNKLYGSISPGKVLSEVNTNAFDVFKVTEQFTSAWCGIIDSQQHTLTYASAGHDYPMIMTDIVIALEDNNGPIMGLVDVIEYRDKTIDFAYPTKLFLYTDGITDQELPNNKRLGRKWLIAELEHYLSSQPENISSTITTKVMTMAAGLEQHDDILAITISLKKNLF